MLNVSGRSLNVPSGRHAEFVVMNMDIMPTILELAGTKPPSSTFMGRDVAPLKGRSWLPYFKGSVSKIHEDDEITGWELFGRMALRKGDYKALFIPKPHGPEKWQLFNVRLDPGETNDLAGSNPTKLDELVRARRREANKGRRRV